MSFPAFSQVKRDTAIYPMIFEDNFPFEYGKGEWVDDVKKANGFRMIISPDTVKSGFVIVNDCFLNGDMRMRGKFTANTPYGALVGTSIEYYRNGNPKAVFNSNAGDLVGEAEAYYPNGKFY